MIEFDSEFELKLQDSIEKLNRMVNEARKDPEFDRLYIETERELEEEYARGLPVLSDEERVALYLQIEHDDELYRLEQLANHSDNN